MLRKVKKIGVLLIGVIIFIIILIYNMEITKIKIIPKNTKEFLGSETIESNITEIQIKDTNLYNEIVSQLNSKYIYKKDDKAQILYIENSNIENIKELQLKDKKIVNTTGIEKFKDLEKLNISSNNIDGLDNISQLKNLKELQISDCGLKSIEKLNTLINLETLDVSVNKLYDTNTTTKENSILAQIKELNKLTNLNIAYNYIKNIEMLENFTELKILNLYNNNVTNLKGLENLKKLEVLNIGENVEYTGKENIIENMEVLKKLENLQNLNFSENYTPNIINNISDLTKLKTLQLEKNNIKNLNGIEKLTNLIDLNLCNNAITNIESLAELQNLEIVRIGTNNILDITPIYNPSTKKEKFLNLKKLDISNNKNLKNNEALQYFCQQSENKNIELDYEYITNTSNLPHYDSDGTAYVTYADFGARCDGEYDDYIAIRNAHIFANNANCEIRIKDKKTYHIYHYYGTYTTIKTNTDWGNSNIIIHDEEIDTVSGRFSHLFKVTNEKDIKTISKPTWKINKNQKNIPEIINTLSTLKQYSKFMCIVENTNKKMYIRYGMNANNGSAQKDIFLVDSQGNVLNDIQWDFEQITSITIIPIQNVELTLKNGNFQSNTIKSGTETQYTIPNSRKDIYFSRGINVSNSSNINIINIKHNLEEKNKLSGSYVGFIVVNTCANVNIKNSEFTARKYLAQGRSTYDLNINTVVNLVFENIYSDNINDAQRWGIIGTNYTKDVTYKNCELNRIDAHQGIYNVTIEKCKIGAYGLTLIGQGDLKIENTSIESDAFITLRDDYGSTWDGNVYVNNCKYIHTGTSIPRFINYSFLWDTDSKGNKKLHDFGYECKFPNLYVNDFTVDLKNSKYFNYMLIISNVTHNYESTYNYDYWPKDIHFNNYKFINNNTNKGEAYMKICAKPIAKKEGIKYNYTLTNCTINESNKQFVTLECMKGIYKTKMPINYSINNIKEGENTVTIYKDDNISSNYQNYNITKESPINELLNNNEYTNYKIIIKSKITEESGTYDGEAVFQINNINEDKNDESSKDESNKDENNKDESNKDESNKDEGNKNENNKEESNKNEKQNDGDKNEIKDNKAKGILPKAGKEKIKIILIIIIIGIVSYSIYKSKNVK